MSDSTIEVRSAARLVLIDTDQRLLLFRHADGHGREFWATPGGGIEAGETAEQATHREAAEELGAEEVELVHLWTGHSDFLFADRESHSPRRSLAAVGLEKSPCFSGSPSCLVAAKSWADSGEILPTAAGAATRPRGRTAPLEANVLSEEPATLTVTEATTGKLTMDKDAYQLTIRMPIEGIKVQPATASSGAAPQNPSDGNADLDGVRLLGPASLRTRADLLSRKQDYVTLIEEFADVVEAETDALRT